MSQLNQIIDGGFCIGCGACNCATDRKVPIELDSFGKFQADLASINLLNTEVDKALYTCPFSDEGPNEDAIGKRLFADHCNHDDRLGYFDNLFTGYVAEDNFRENGSSGGVITWILAELLQRGEVDGVVHVRKVDNPTDGILFRYGISRTINEVKAGAKSRYYPIEMSEVLAEIKNIPGRYVVVGLPCFIKAIRRISDIDPIIHERVVFCVGLICGHLKSKAFADCFAWQLGIPVGQLEEIDFRVKMPERTAGDYGVYMRGAGIEATHPTSNFLGSNWGHNFFRYSACDYCDDVFAETADVVIGDAWLPEYEADPKGNSVVLVRNKALGEIIQNGIEKSKLHVTQSSAEKVSLSQAGGIRDRREGLAYRLYVKVKKKQWVPNKRVNPTKKNINNRRLKIYQNRMEIGISSHHFWKEAVEADNFGYFQKKIRPMIKKNQRLYRSLISRIINKIVRVTKKSLNSK